jgi:nucleotide-binding universal stress UspA family protein
MIYSNILAALDGSSCSDLAADAALSLAGSKNAYLIGCHVYAARLHRTRFADMEPGLPDNYQGGNLDGLRYAHEGLIKEGLQLISNSYLDMLSRRAKDRGIRYKSITPEGRNYTEILNISAQLDADLIVLGAWGQGGDRPLGSTAERILIYSNAGDVLLMRDEWSFDRRPIIVGVDGSENSYSALRRAIEIASVYGAEVRAVSVYDPFFHSGVFKNIASSLTDRAKGHFDISTQEAIHNEIIDEGLEKLYRAGLDKGVRLARSLGVDVKPKVLAGKISPEIQKYALENDASLIVVGKWGLHREKRSLIGSNALRLARLCMANVLVVDSDDHAANSEFQAQDLLVEANIA